MTGALFLINLARHILIHHKFNPNSKAEQYVVHNCDGQRDKYPENNPETDETTKVNNYPLGFSKTS
jgi:hypothetical protein